MDTTNPNTDSEKNAGTPIPVAASNRVPAAPNGQVNVIRTCFEHYAVLIHQLGLGNDIRPQLRREFPAHNWLSRFLPESHVVPPVCTHSPSAAGQYAAAAEAYIILGPGLVETRALTEALQNMLLHHRQLLDKCN